MSTTHVGAPAGASGASAASGADVRKPYRFLTSAIGRKQVMAVSGLVWSGFVMAHMAGNLLMFAGPDAYNRYGHALVSNPAIYVAEAALVVTILLHFINGIALTIENRRARPYRYAMSPNGEKAPRFQSRFMVFHGLLLAVFIVWHLVTFKFGPTYMTVVNGVEMRDLYRLLVEVFQQPFYVAFYAACMVAVGLHLSHGFYSAFASLGAFHPKWEPTLNRIGFVYAAVVAAGFASQPIYIFLVH